MNCLSFAIDKKLMKGVLKIKFSCTYNFNLRKYWQFNYLSNSSNIKIFMLYSNKRVVTERVVIKRQEVVQKTIINYRISRFIGELNIWRIGLWSLLVLL